MNLSRSLVFAALLAAAALPARSQEPPQDRLSEAVQALQKERRAYYARLEAREREIQEERRKLDVLLREKQERTERRQALQDELAAAKQESDGLRARIAAGEELEKKLGAAADRAVAAAEAFVKESIPADVAHRSERLKADGQKPLDRLETIRGALREEAEDAKSASLRSEEVTLPDGRRKPARVARVGTRFLFFVTEDGLDGGTMERSGEGWAWKTADAEGLASLKKAVRIMARQDAPGRAALPLELGK